MIGSKSNAVLISSSPGNRRCWENGRGSPCARSARPSAGAATSDAMARRLDMPGRMSLSATRVHPDKRAIEIGKPDSAAHAHVTCELGLQHFEYPLHAIGAVCR